MQLTEAECAALAIMIGLKSFARAEAFEREGLGAYSADCALIAGLVSKRLVKVNRAGAIAVEREFALATLATHTRPTAYRLGMINAHGYFAKVA